MKTFIKFAIIAVVAFSLSSCSDEKDNLMDAIVDAWDVIEDDIEESSEDALKDYEDNPSLLFDGDCETSYNSFADIFTLKIPINRKGRAAIGLLFGNDAANFLSLLDDTGTSSRSKSDVKNLILKHFNSSWARMFVALIILDGEFDYDFETDDLLDASYEFDSKDLFKILNEKEYFSGGYGDPLPTSSDNTK
ncbi:MAG: hypothetical protein K2K84_00810 [Muribaculaceae bacterium]|nr:hypothetical protein [Muribaculaceae bacterium]